MNAQAVESAERYLVAAALRGWESVEHLSIRAEWFGIPDAQRVWQAARAVKPHGGFWEVIKHLGWNKERLFSVTSEEAILDAQLPDCVDRVREAWIVRTLGEVGQLLQAGKILPAEAVRGLERVVEAAAVVDGPRFADIGSILAGGIKPELPSVAALLYSGRLNEIHAEPSAGKTNVSLALALAVMKDGGHVVYLDPEDTAESALRRLVAFGARPEIVTERFHHIAAPTPDDYMAAMSWSKRHKPQLVVVDGIAEALAGLGLDEDTPADFLAFCRDNLTPFATAGAAVLVADHVVKNAESRGRWARGTGAKMGRYDGASYALEVGKSYTPTSAGFVRMKVAKDRNGGVGGIGQHVADVHFIPTANGGTMVDFRRPEVAEEFIPTGIMEKISRRLEAVPNSSKRDLRALAKSQYVEVAIEKLVELKHLEVVNLGPGKPSSFRLKTPYREASNE